MTNNLKKAQRKASSPEARAKAVATLKRRREEKRALMENAVAFAEGRAQPETMSLDAIPDREPKRKYNKRPKVPISGHFVTEDEWLFLQMAKRMLRGVK
jgi:hypothetical protein